MTSNLVRGRGGGGGGGAGGGALQLIHSPTVTPVAQLENVSGQIRGSLAQNISDLTRFTSVTAGTFGIGSVTLTGIDLSVISSISAVMTVINAAIATETSLSGYALGLLFENSVFYFGMSRTSGDVEAISGTIEPLFGMATPATRTDFELESSPVILPERAGGGDYTHLMVRALGQTYLNTYWTFQSDVWVAQGEDPISNHLGFNNSGGWLTSSYQGTTDIPLGVIQAFNIDYYTVLYDPATRAISWREETPVPGLTSFKPSIDTLMVLGR